MSDTPTAPGGTCTAESEHPPMLDHSYLLLTHIPYYVDDDGSVWLEALWHHDFAAHLRYVRRLTLVAPRYPKRETANLVKVTPPDGSEVRFVGLPRFDSNFRALLNLPRICVVLAKSIIGASIVHSGVVGWPFPLGWVANPLTRLFRKKLVVVIESAPWRLTDPSGAGWKRKLRACVYEWLARWSVNRADLSIFTQPAYRESLKTSRSGAEFISPASWINDGDVLPISDARAAWNRKSGMKLSLLFAGRLTSDKGLPVLIGALKELERRHASVSVDIIGEGPLREECQALEQQLETVRVRMLDPVAYGPGFFCLLRSYHAVVVPSLSDEQPRIVFDAYSQAVPVVASDTDGLRPYVQPDVTGWLVPRGKVDALADRMLQLTDEPLALREAGLRGRAMAERATHVAMHEQRWRVLVEQFGSGSQGYAT